MNVFQLIGKEFQSIFKSYKTAIPFIVILCIPLIYAGMFLWAFWDPYGKTEHIVVGVVNEDKGAKIEKKDLNIGKDLVKKLKKDDNFTWRFLSKKEAKKQLKNQDISLYIYVPSDFSEHATTLLDDKMKKPTITYVSNQGINYLTSKIGDAGIEKVKNNVSREVRKKYAEVMFDKMKELSDGLKKASDGSTDIGKGLNDLLTGTTEMVTTLEGKQTNLNDLANGASRLETGLHEAQNGLSSLTTGTSQVQQGSQQLTNGTQQLSSALQQYSEKMNTFAEQTGTLTTTTGQLNQALQVLVATHPELQQDPTFQKIMMMGAGINQGMTKVQPAVQQFQAGANQLATSSGTLVAGQTKLTQSLQQVAEGQQKVATGVSQLAQGSTQLTSGTKDVSTGWLTLTENVRKLKDGEQKLADGNKELTDKLTEAYEKTNEVKGNDQRYKMFADPISLKKNPINKVPNYGTGLAPYFLSMGLYIGMLILTVIYDLKKSAGSPRTGLGWYGSKTVVIVFVSICQALLIDLVLLKGLHIHVFHITEFVLFSIVVSLTFASIVQFFTSTMANVGRFFVILIMVLQLTGSAGTFPLELLPKTLQNVHDYLPMTHTILGFKAIISTNDIAKMYHSVGILAIYFASFSLLTILYFTLISWNKKRKQKEAQ